MIHGKDGWDLIEYSWTPEEVKKIYAKNEGNSEVIYLITEASLEAALSKGFIGCGSIEQLERNERGVYL